MVNPEEKSLAAKLFEKASSQRDEAVALLRETFRGGSSQDAIRKFLNKIDS